MNNDHRVDIRHSAERYTAALELAQAIIAGDVYDDDSAHDWRDDDYARWQTIAEFKSDYGPDAWEEDAATDYLDTFALDVDVWVRATDPDTWRADVYLTVGGPTVVVHVDSDQGWATFEHSWGKDAAGNDRHTWEVDADPWREYVEPIAESYAASMATY